MLIRCFKGLIVLSERLFIEMEKGVGHWYEKKMERINTKQALLGGLPFCFSATIWNLNKKTSVWIKHKNENAEHIPQSVTNV